MNATETAESAAISRMTLYRIERGDPSVAMGAYLAVISTLGLELNVTDPKMQKTKGSRTKLPAQIKLAEYPQLKRLAWQVKESAEITPEESLDIYERNWRHVDVTSLIPEEQELLEALAIAFGRERLLV